MVDNLMMRPGVLIKRIFPSSSVRTLFRIGAYMPADALELISGLRYIPIPPRGMRFDNAASYISMGHGGLSNLERFCDLQPESKVLEAGCGAGRMATPFGKFLTTGYYEGFDIVPSWIKWCQRNITSHYPNVRFKWVDVYSKHYNSKGKIAARDFVFPYENGSFDCAMMMSLFTHMLPDGIQNYIQELSRVLRRGAKAYVTALLLNDEAIQAIGERRSAFDLRFSKGDCRVVDSDFPETTIAVPESHMLTWFGEAGLKSELKYGSWAGRQNCHGLHDDIVVEKL